MDLSKHLTKADEAARRRNYPLAIGLYQQILDLDPDQAEARAGLRKALDGKFEGKKGGGILAYVQGFLPLLSAAVARLTKGWTARARNLERFLALGPNHVGANLALGDALYRGGHRRSAYVVYRHLGDRLGQAGRAGPHAERAGQALRAAGAIAYEQKRLDEAMDCYEAALEINPRDQDALRARKNLSAEGQLEGAGFATARSARELVKDDKAQQKVEKAQRLHRSDDELKADLQEAEARLGQSPDDPVALREVGDLRARTGDIGGALDCLEKALELQPDDTRLMARVGELRVREIEEEIKKARLLGDDERAADLEQRIASMRLSDARRRVEAHPTDLALRHELGRLLLEAGELDAAIAELQKSVQDPRLKLEALLSLGRAFRDKGLHDLARGQLEKALEATGARHALRLDILYELGGLAEQDGESVAARGYYARILEVDIGYKDVSGKLESLTKETKESQ